MSLLAKANKIRKNKGYIQLINRSYEFFFPKFKTYVLNFLCKIWLTAIGDPIVKFSTIAGEIKYEIDPEDFSILYDFTTQETYEPVLTKALHTSLNEDSIFYNIGARWGYFSIFAQHCSVPNSQIYNFEANQSDYNILKKNMNGETNLIRTYISDTNSDDTTTLDTYAEQNRPPTVIKMDIQGAEFRAIDGATEILATEKPELFIEIHPSSIPEQSKGSQEALIRKLKQYDYTMTIADHRSEQSGWVPVNEADLPTEGDYLLHCFDPVQ